MSARRPSWKQGFARSADESEAPREGDGLVGAWLPFLGVQGATLYDLSGYGAHGALTNMELATDWVPTTLGYGLDFSTDDSVQVPALPHLNGLTGAVSVAVWVWLRTISGGGLLEKTIAGSVNKQFLLFSDAGGLIWRVVSATIFYTVQGGTPTTGTWNFIVGTYDGSVVRLYLNALESGTPLSLGTPLDGGSGVTLIGHLGSGIYALDGIISQVRVYNRGLRPDEISQMYLDPFARWRLRRRTAVASLGAAASAIPAMQAAYRRRRVA